MKINEVRPELRFAFFAFAVFSCYSIFALLQEKITRGKYGAKKETYKCVLTLVCFECTVNFVFATGLMIAWKQAPDQTTTLYYVSSASTYLMAMVFSTGALQYISYPTQVVGKAAKPIPVMVLGVLLGRKKYPLKKYLFVLLIVVGIALFMYKDKKKPGHATESNGFYGEIMLVCSLTMDGLTGAVQERIKGEGKATAYSMMLNTNKWSALFSGVGVLVTLEIFKFIKFVSKYPEILIYIVAISFMGAVGQLFIFSIVSEFGPLPCAVVTTTRKFFTVLASVIIFGNVLLPRQWVGAIIVFTGLFLDIFHSKKGKKPQQQPQQQPQQPAIEGAPTAKDGQAKPPGGGSSAPDSGPRV